MNPRIIVSVQENEHGDLQVFLSKAPRYFDNARMARLLQLDGEGLPSLGPPDGVREYGQKLFHALSGHNAIQEALADAMARPEATPIFFDCTAPDAERLAWETLCTETGEFLALTRERPIARLADSMVDTGNEEIAWHPPLRIFAVLSAIPYSAVPEWENLLRAVRDARTEEFPIELRVLVGEEELLESIREFDDPWISADVVPESPVDLVMAVEDFKPQILHFFCHGTVAYGGARLELASLRDWTLKDATDRPVPAHGSVRLDVSKLSSSQSVQRSWLVTLNCCEGARASEEVHSLAHSLVSRGVGAAVGMLEPFDANDAHEFSSRFYPAVLKHIRERFQDVEVGASFEIEWSGCLYYPRDALSQKGPEEPQGVRRWTLPVLYTPPDRFLVRHALSADPEANLKARVDLDVIGGLLSLLGDRIPPEIRAGAGEILSDATETLYGDEVR